MPCRSSSALVFAFAGAALLAPAAAHADVQHTVARGHTLEAIANRYHVTVQSIVDANHIKDAKHLKVGDVLTIPKVDPPKKAADKKKDKDEERRGERLAKLGLDKKGPHGKTETPTFAQKPKTPGVVHLRRLATAEEQDIRVGTQRAHVPPASLKAFERLMRSQGGLAHPIDARLAALVAVVSNHFGSRRIDIVSGFRPFTPTQYNPHSNHNHGKAIDFRIVGVPNEVVRDYCRTLKNVGCGYYPNSTFVHMDTRDTSAFWIDYSKPGEPPRYNAPNVDADEGTSEVHDDAHLSTTAPPSDAPASDAPSSEPAPAGEPSPSEPTPAPAQPESAPAPTPPEEQAVPPMLN